MLHLKVYTLQQMTKNLYVADVGAIAIVEERAAVADKIEGPIVAVIENVDFHFSGQGLQHSSAKAQSETRKHTVACPTVENHNPKQPQRHLSKSSPKQS